MGKEFKIKPTQVETNSSYIKPTEADTSVPVSFNFKHLTNKSKKFNYSNQAKKYFLKFLERLSTVSTMCKSEMIIENQKGLRCHPIDFADSRVSEDTFGLSPELDDEAWQFQISSNKHGRVHGYFVSNVFYVVWLDPDHALYPGGKK